METPPRESPPAPDPPPRTPDEEARRELDGLRRLRERVAAAAREIERLRAENADLAERVASLEAAGGDAAAGGGLVLPGIDGPEELRETVQGFIDTIDRLLAEPAEPDAS